MDPYNVCAFCVLQKHGLKLHFRNPYSFTPMLEEGTLSKAPRSLLLGTDMAGNQKQISQFSQKDAQVGKVSGNYIPPQQPRAGFWEEMDVKAVGAEQSGGQWLRPVDTGTQSRRVFIWSC